MNNLAIIGASYLQLPLIEKAKEMGYKTHVFAWKANDVGEKEADFFYPISIIEKEEILDKCREIGICGICSIASDLAVVTVNYVAEKMQLCGNTIASTEKCTNKYVMRKTFWENGDPSPSGYLITNVEDLQSFKFEYPVIVKPTDRSGSRGVCKVDTHRELVEAVEQALSESFVKEAVVEEYVSGKEYSMEYISFHGEHHFLALTEKLTTGAPYFIETGHRQPANVDDAILIKLQNIVEHALESLEIRNGASHAELKLASDGSVKIIEIGARMGGDCIGSDLVRYSTGYDFLQMVIQVACGERPDFYRQNDTFGVESVFLFTQDDLHELENLKKNYPDKLVRIVSLHLENIGKITDSSNRAGCYIRKI